MIAQWRGGKSHEDNPQIAVAMKTGRPPPRYGSRWTTGSAEIAPQALRRAAITELPGDVAADAHDGAGGGLLVLREEVAPLLGV